MPSPQKTWIEISARALARNTKTLRALLVPQTQLWAVVKSNAYGHGLALLSKELAKYGVDGFCVDSVIEGLKLRREGIKQPILVLGPTLPSAAKQATDPDIMISVSSLEALKRLVKEIPQPARRPTIHLKIDTGMHRQGFFVHELPTAIAYIKKHHFRITGVFSHFASAKDINYPTLAQRQFAEFQRAVQLLVKEGFTGLTRHIAATGGTLINPAFHLDAVRIGIGLYGIYPSKELEVQIADQIPLYPVLSWRSIISEIKTIPKGEYVGYDCTERVIRRTTLAVVPVGYWHGLPWALSGVGYVLIRGKRCKILGRIAMDMIVVDITGIRCALGDRVTLIGTDGKEEITAREIAGRAGGTTPYEIITRLNPLIDRVIVE